MAEDIEGLSFVEIKQKIEAKNKELAEAQSGFALRKKLNFDRGEMEEDLKATLQRMSKEERINQASGVDGDALIESKPTYIKAKGERVFATPNNSYLVLGRDRPGNKRSGYGGMGATGAGSVDIVVGRQTEGKKRLVDPNFETDSARIHVSQKTDVDSNFNLVSSAGAPESKARASIGMKADTVRVVARENIRLVTLGPGKKNSHGGLLQSTGGIDLIAGNNNSDVQPLVKGDNLVEAMTEMTNLIDSLAGIVNGFLQEQLVLNGAIQNHFHHSPFFGLPTTPSPSLLPIGNKVQMNLFSKTKIDLIQIKINLINYKFTYLSNINPKGYINSKYNSTN